MEPQVTGRSERQKSYKFRNRLFKLTIVGATVFWLATFAISLLPIAAEYRAAFSNSSIHAVWIGALFAGLIIGCCVSYFLLRFSDKIPTKNPIFKPVMLSFFVLLITTILIDIPMLSHGSNDAPYYFLVGVIFNVVRFLLLGLVIGFVYKKMSNSAKNIIN